MDSSIDVVIPSFRLDEKILLPILALRKPDGFNVHFYLIADNPSVAVPDSIHALSAHGRVTLLINKENCGFSATRNRGIDAGHGRWILLLDDDIHPSPDLLIRYAEAIASKPDSIGFVGVTLFPEPDHPVGRALVLNGSLGHFQKALKEVSLPWAPTTNVLLSRPILGKRRFNPQLKVGGEDIALLAAISLLHRQQYICVPNAIVTHPWWQDGRSQVKRLFRYGLGTGEVMTLPEFRPYTFIDFTNTSESLCLIMIYSMVGVVFDLPISYIPVVTAVLLLAEVLTTGFRAMLAPGKVSPLVVFEMLAHKNAYELGMLWGGLRSRGITNFTRRLDLGFRKPDPSPFRLNKWKIVKMALFLLILFLVIVAS